MAQGTSKVFPSWAVEQAAQLWCLPQHSSKVMDSEFAYSIADALSTARQEAIKQAQSVATCDDCQHQFSIIQDDEGEWTRCASCEERERCAKVAEKFALELESLTDAEAKELNVRSSYLMAKSIATAIREGADG